MGFFCVKKKLKKSFFEPICDTFTTIVKLNVLNRYNHNIFSKAGIATAVILIVCMIITGCSESNRSKNAKEGSIKYKITYLASEKENPIIGLLPSTITMRFKGNKVILDMEGWLGIFKSSFIKDESNNTYTLLKILNKKYLYASKRGEGFYGIKGTDNMIIDFDDECKDIVGFNCKHSVVTVDDSIKFDIYYTESINIKGVAANTPLDKIPGMLMEFRVVMNGIPMQLNAIEYSNDEVPDSAFEIPEDYTRIERSQMDEIFNSIGQKPLDNKK